MNQMKSKKQDGGRRRAARDLAVGYARVSTAHQGESGLSMDAQRVAIEKFADAAGYYLIETFSDVASGVGAKSLNDRDGLQAALELAAREGAKLIVWDWDRLSRYSGFEKQVRKHLPDPAQIICIRRENKIHAASRSAEYAHGEAVASEISRRTKEGMNKKRADGVTFGNPEILTHVQPIGVTAYSVAADNLVDRIADAMRETEGSRNFTHKQVADLLNEKGLRTLHGKDWNASRIRKPLKKAHALLLAEDEEDMRNQPQFGMF